jgi:O-acetylhomoserine/O-acetylserine sulfhydrylase-like pyridoxal-dependent enzyme
MVEQWDFDTLKVMAGYNSAQHELSVAVPVHQTASFELGNVARARRPISFTETGFVYPRVANPNADVLAQRVAAFKYPSARSSFNSALDTKYLPKGSRSVLLCGYLDTTEGADKPIGFTNLFDYQANIGDSWSLTSNVSPATHRTLAETEERLTHIPHAIRLTVRPEPPTGWINDCEHSSAKAQRACCS